MSTRRARANAEAHRRLCAADPILIDILPALEALPVAEPHLERPDDVLDDRRHVHRQLPDRAAGEAAAARLVTRKVSSVGKEKVDREVTSRYAGFGLGFAILAALGMISLGARWP